MRKIIRALKESLERAQAEEARHQEVLNRPSTVKDPERFHQALAEWEVQRDGPGNALP